MESVRIGSLNAVHVRSDVDGWERVTGKVKSTRREAAEKRRNDGDIKM